MKTPEIVRAAVRRFIVDTLLHGEDTPDLTDDLELRPAGVLDSLGLVRLVSFVEREFSFDVEPAEAGLDNFGSIERIVAFVRRRTAPDAL